ncbi:MAG: hypothetical protein JWO79_2928 [Actinomycetia bacterium]|jgi:hypothetical protein|nr:hypothetical protein [Actinomycetes bacterium]MDQ1651540.1 hypothetical protein [Cryptosporangiaceae bacterium]MDQ1658328.1 hypothetical protein [Cryptosporangiaceae bacterium]MDT5038467.1 hypothetical protein [Micromonosporaceae bacterium]
MRGTVTAVLVADAVAAEPPARTPSVAAHDAVPIFRTDPVARPGEF